MLTTLCATAGAVEAMQAATARAARRTKVERRMEPLFRLDLAGGDRDARRQRQSKWLALEAIPFPICGGSYGGSPLDRFLAGPKSLLDAPVGASWERCMATN